MTVRQRFALLAVMSAATAAHAEPWQPLTEQPGAVAAAADAVKKATEIETKDKQAALSQFARIAHDHPAALHECYLALSNLRAGFLTEARLALDVSATMGGERPKWCTGKVADELAKALADHHYAQIAIEVTPPDAVVTVNSTELRGITSVWWEPWDSVGVWVSAPGYETQNAMVPLTGPSPRIAFRLQPQAPAKDVDAGVTITPPPPVPADAGVTAVAPPPPIPPDAAPSPAGGQKTIVLGITLASIAVSGVSFYLTSYYHDQADGLYKTDPRFDDTRNAWQDWRGFAVGAAGLAVIGLGYYTYLAITGDRATPNLDGSGLRVGATRNGGGVTWTWSFR